MTWTNIIIIAVLAYLIGSFSFGIFLSALQGKDIRKEGSKSSGATNVTRVMGLSLGMITFLGDFIKAVIAIWIGWLLEGTNGAMLAGVLAVVGHNWPVYYQFRGGKGVVCSVAVLLIICPLEGSIAAVLAVLVIWLTKYVSLGSLTYLFVASVMLLILRGFHPYGWWSLILLALGIFQHRTNIKRLLSGKENKLSFKKPASK